MNSADHDDKIDPYRLLFPLGILLGFLGVLLWLFFQVGWIHFYPRAAHGNMMFFGLLWSFVAGFLMTAVPKMTSTAPAHTAEISAAISLTFLQLVLNIRNLTDISVVMFLLQNILLAFFIVRRFLVHRKVPFFGFVFLPMAFFQSFLGIGLFLSGSFDRGTILLFCGEAFVLNLIIGLGSRLIPVISRLPNSLSPHEKSSSSEFPIWPVLTLVLINGGYWLELFGQKDLGIVFRVIGLIAAMIKLFRFFTKPVTVSYVGISLKIALLMLPLGEILGLSYFNFSLAGLHLIYIGGFSMITLMIATRVMLAHGGQTLDYEVSAPRIAIITGLLVTSALLRWFVGINIASPILTISALIFIISVGLWSMKFFKILNSIRHKP